MIATSQYRQPHAFRPAVPSPLSSRSANIYGGSRRRQPNNTSFSLNSMASPSTLNDENGIFSSKYLNATTTSASETTVVPSSTSRVPFAQRRVKAAPTPRAETLRTQRRDQYLRRVQEGREEKRYELRGEDMMRLDFVRRQRAWEAEQARASEGMIADEDDFGEFDALAGGENAADLPRFPGSQMQMSTQGSELMPDEDEVEDFLRDEDQELAALLEYMPGEEPEHGHESDGLWSDDVDYDELFSHVLGQQSDTRNATTQEMDVRMEDEEEMDVT